MICRLRRDFEEHQCLPGLEEIEVGGRHDDRTLSRCDEAVDGVVEAFVDVVENDVDVFEENDGRLVQLRHRRRVRILGPALAGILTDG